MSSNVEALGGRGTIVAFLDLLFSCIGIFIAVITLQSVSNQQSPPAVGADAYYGVLADGSVLAATADGVASFPTPVDAEAAMRSSIAANEAVYPRIEVLFSGAAIEEQRALEHWLNRLVASLKPARAIETNWRPAVSDEAVREELKRIAGSLRKRRAE